MNFVNANQITAMNPIVKTSPFTLMHIYKGSPDSSMSKPPVNWDQALINLMSDWASEWERKFIEWGSRRG